MNRFLGNKAKILLQTWFQPTPQKTVRAIQAIPHDNRIYARMWGTGDGWFKTELYYKWWMNIPDFKKEWRKEDFEEFCMAYVDFSGNVHPHFWDGFTRYTVNHQRIYVDKFISAHEPMIRRELEEHYEKYSKISKL